MDKDTTPSPPKNRKASTDTEAKTAKAEAKEYKLSYGHGLYLLVKPNGHKYWRLKYRFNGVEKSPVSFGVYPQVSLKHARKLQANAKELLAQGIDPNEHKKAAKQLEIAQTEHTFEAVALEWMEKHPPHADVTANKNRWLLNFAFVVFGKKAITDVTAPDVLGVCRRIEDSGRITTAHSVKSKCSQVFRYAIATGKAIVDPTLSLRGALTPKVIQHRPSITDPKEVATLLRAINGYQGQFVTICALKLAPLVFIRPGELRQALWEEIDLDAAEWRYRVSKTNTDHIVPLSAQALAILHELHAVTGRGKFVFPSIRVNTRPMSENTINSALRALGYDSNQMCGHGFRAMARTILDEVLQYRIDVIEQQLAHAVKDMHGRAYNRTKHLPERKAMMQHWSDYLDGLQVDNVISVKFGGVA